MVNAVADPTSVTKGLTASSCVFQSHCIPAPLCTRLIAYLSHRVPVPLRICPIVYQSHGVGEQWDCGKKRLVLVQWDKDTMEL